MDYEVTPERPGDGTPDERSSTAHHESLLRAERARAARSRRALGSFVVAGLAAATVVGVVTWQSVANEEEGRSTQVQESTHETSLPSAAPDDTSGDPSSLPAVPETGDEPENDGDVSEQGVATTTQDQYLAPNTWYDGQGSYEDNPGFGDGSDGDQGAEGTEGNATGVQGEGDGAEGADPESPNLPSDERPWLTELLPTIPDLPTVPGEPDPSGAPDEDDEENTGNTETEEDGQSTPGSSPGNSSEPANPAGDIETSSTGMEPTEPGGTGNTGDTADTDATGNDDEAAESPTVTDTTGPSPE